MVKIRKKKKEMYLSQVEKRKNLNYSKIKFVGIISTKLHIFPFFQPSGNFTYQKT